MVGHRLSVSASLASLAILIVSSIVDASIQECTESGAASCPSSIGKVKSSTSADLASDRFDEEVEEDASDADYSVHMQMRLTVDLPAVGEKEEPVIHASALSSFGGDAHSSTGEGSSIRQSQHHAHDEHDAIAMLAGPATVHKPPPEPVLPAAEPASGSNLLLGILICALLVVVGVLVGTLLWTVNKERQAKDQAELKAAAKAWMLDWALGFEPDKELEEDSVVKIQLHKKKMPPTPNEIESSDTDEEEPEAESESEPAFELEEAVFQAAQVEVANEASANEYGIVRDVRLADQILPCH